MPIYIEDKEDYQLFLTNIRYAAELEKRNPETFNRFLLELAKRDADFLLNSPFYSNKLSLRNKALYRKLKEDREKRQRGEQ